MLDTNAVLNLLDPRVPTALPASTITHISVITHVELNYGIAAALNRHTTESTAEASRRTANLQRVLSTWTPVPLDSTIAAAFQQVAESALSAGQNPRQRMNDLMIAATALTRDWTLVTNDEPLTRALTPLVRVVPL
nr:PIN domain-containing protein [Kineococcus vitellinus]